LTDTDVYSLVVSDTNLFAGTYDGIFLSTNNGENWTAVNNGLSSTYVSSLAVSGSTLFAGTNDGGVFLSTNNAASWIAVNSGLTKTFVQSFAFSGTDLFAATAGKGVWKRPLSEMITSVEGDLTKIPLQFNLCQNYPNPFNPSTLIRYELPRQSLVTLKIYDILGREVAILVNEQKPAGRYETRFDGKSLSSGVYFYRIKAGDFVQTKKMVLAK
jgi:hypothetical protein